MNAEIGGHILKNTDGLTVDVKHPDIPLRIEIREEATFLTIRNEKAPEAFLSVPRVKRC